MAPIKKEPKLQSKFKTEFLPDELAKMLARAHGRSLADCRYADELVPEFDLVKNYPLTPWHVTAGSGISVFWKANCPGGMHKFRNTVAARSNAYKNGSVNRGCKLCSKFRYVPSMPITKHHPQVACEWMERENGFPTRFLDSRSSRTGLFKCAENPAHIFRSKVRNRTTTKFTQGCPFCYRGARVNLKKYPAALLLYDRTGKNRGFNHTSLPAAYKVFWRCPDGHTWYQSVNQTIEEGCPQCLLVEPDQQTLADISALKIQYWASLNDGRSAESILIKGNSKLILRWRCTDVDQDEHIFPARLYDRLKGSSCPFCVGRKASKLNSLANPKYEAVVQEIDRSEHPDLDPGTISDRSGKKLSFVCRLCHRKWKARIDYRCRRGQGCSSCKAKLRVKSDIQTQGTRALHA